MPAANRIDAIKFIGLWGAHYTINNYSKEPPKIVLVIFFGPYSNKSPAQTRADPTGESGRSPQSRVPVIDPILLASWPKEPLLEVVINEHSRS